MQQETPGTKRSRIGQHRRQPRRQHVSCCHIILNNLAEFLAFHGTQSTKLALSEESKTTRHGKGVCQGSRLGKATAPGFGDTKNF